MNNIVDGKMVKGGKYIDIISPFDQSIVSKASVLSGPQTDAVFKLVTDSQISITTPEKVIAFDNFIKKAEFNYSSLVELHTKETGRPIEESKRELDFLIKAVNKYKIELLKLKEVVYNEGNFKVFKERVPLGVCLFLLPKIEPIQSFVRKVIPAIMMDNKVIIKPSSETPLLVSILSFYLSLELPKGAITLIQGKREDLDELLNKDFDMVTLVGKTMTGIDFVNRKSTSLNKMIFDLSEFNMGLVTKSNYQEAALELATSSIFHSGQSNKSIKRVFIDESIYQEFIYLVKNHLKGFKIEDPMKPDTKFSSMISKYHTLRLSKQIIKIVQEGGNVLFGGRYIENFFQPTVIEVPFEYISNLEILGPILLISPFKNINDAINVLNKSIYGGTLSLYTLDQEEIKLVKEKANFGNILINASLIQDIIYKVDGWKLSSNNIITSDPFMVYSKEKLTFLEEKL